MLPAWLARFNRYVTNPVARPFASRVPPLAIVVHRGRRTGRTYRIPVMAFQHGDGYAIALTYGRDRPWVRNVVAAGDCELERLGRTIPLKVNDIVDVGTAGVLPGPIRAAVRAMGVHDVLRLSAPSGRAGAEPE